MYSILHSPNQDFKDLKLFCTLKIKFEQNKSGSYVTQKLNFAMLSLVKNQYNKTRGLRRWPSHSQFNPGSRKGGSRQTQPGLT